MVEYGKDKIARAMKEQKPTTIPAAGLWSASRSSRGKWMRNTQRSSELRCEKGSTSCAPRWRNCISCVPRCLFHVYQLRPELSTPSMTSCVPRLVTNCISCIERYGYIKCPTIGRFLHSFIVLYFIHNYMNTYRIVEWYRQHSCYIMLLSNV